MKYSISWTNSHSANVSSKFKQNILFYFRKIVFMKSILKQGQALRPEMKECLNQIPNCNFILRYYVYFWERRGWTRCGTYKIRRCSGSSEMWCFFKNKWQMAIDCTTWRLPRNMFIKLTHDCPVEVINSPQRVSGLESILRS